MYRRQTLLVNRTSYSVAGGETFTGGVARRVRNLRRIASQLSYAFGLPASKEVGAVTETKPSSAGSAWRNFRLNFACFPSSESCYTGKPRHRTEAHSPVSQLVTSAGIHTYSGAFVFDCSTRKRTYLLAACFFVRVLFRYRMHEMKTWRSARPGWEP